MAPGPTGRLHIGEPNLQNIPIRMKHVYFDRPDGRYRLATIREVVEAHVIGAAGILFHYLEVEFPPGEGLKSGVHACVKVKSYGHNDEGPDTTRPGPTTKGEAPESTGGVP
jgi:hypothetical protein